MRKKTIIKKLLCLLFAFVLTAGSLTAAMADEPAPGVSEVSETSENPEEPESPGSGNEENVTETPAVPAEGGGESEPEEPETPPAPAREMIELTLSELAGTVVINVDPAELDAWDVLTAAVWSVADGQDDLRWYELDPVGGGLYERTVKLSGHKGKGEYQVHVYKRSKTGQMTFIGHNSFEVEGIRKGTLEVEELCYKEGTADIRLTGATSGSGLAEATVAVWSDTRQSDIRWYDAERQEDGSWTFTMDIKNHRENRALYQLHAYARDNAGNFEFVGNTEADFSLRGASISSECLIESNSYLLKIEGFEAPENVAEIQAAVWSDEGGQDDLTWNTMAGEDGDYIFKGSLNTLKHVGNVTVHVYVRLSNGNMVFLGNTAFRVQPASASGITVTADNAAGTFTIDIGEVISAIPVKNVRAAVWSTPNQSDILWYTLKDNGDGIWSLANGNIKNHKYNTGRYYVHVYITLANGVTSFLCNDEFVMEIKSAKEFTVTDMNAGIAGEEQKKYRIAVENVEIPGGAKDVRFALWNENNFQGLIWHTASRDGSSYYVDVNVASYRLLGTYVCHVYYTSPNGVNTFLMGGNCFTVDGRPSGNVSATVTDEHEGSFDVTVSGVSAPSGINSVRVACWTDESGNNRNWYNAERQADGTYKASCTIKDNNYGLGHYYIHVYASMGNGIEAFSCSGALDFNPSDFIYVKNGGAFSVTVGMKNPHAVPTTAYIWSEEGGQDDLRTFSFTSNGGGSYSAPVSMGNYSRTGRYICHVYSDSEFLAATTFNWESAWRYENGYKFLYINGVRQTNLTSYIDNGFITGPYRIDINRTCCTITVYARDGGNGYIIPVIAMACSVGVMTPALETPTGDYQTHFKQRWRELMGPSYGQYVTCIMPNYGIHFHSVAGYRMSSHNLSYTDYNMLGQPASHGCVRLCVRDAKWIYDYMPIGTWVHIYDSSYPGPFGKPATIKITPDMDYDPTDPNL